MAEKSQGQTYIEEGKQTQDPEALRKLLASCAHHLDRAEAHIKNLELTESPQERAANRKAAALLRIDAAAAEARAKAIRAVVKLLPTAIAQARKGKPAVLRLIVRATR